MSDNALRELVEKHTLSLKQSGLSVIEYLKSDPPNIDEARLGAHTIKGAAGSIGFETYSNAALNLEQHLKKLIASGESLTQQSAELLTVFEHSCDQLTPEKSSLY